MHAKVPLLAAVLAFPAVALGGTFQDYVDANTARDRKDWPACANLFEVSAEPPAKGSVRAKRLLAAAGCKAQGGGADEAFRLLGQATQGGFLETSKIEIDPYLVPLRTDPRWAGALFDARKSEEAFRKTIGAPSLRSEFLSMLEEDVALRAKPIGSAEYRQMVAMSARHVARLKEVMASKRWPGFKVVGEDGSLAAFIIVQHADEDVPFQKACIELLAAAVKAGDASGANLAFLTDRVAVNEGRKQTYGVMFSDGKPLPIEDPEHVDERRKAVGLEPLEEYRKRLYPDPRPSPTPGR